MLAGKPFRAASADRLLYLEAANTPQRFRLAFTGMGNTNFILLTYTKVKQHLYFVFLYCTLVKGTVPPAPRLLEL